MALNGAGARAAESRAEESGRAWADAVREGLEREGRRAAGGWPGTVSEARARVADLGEPAGASAGERDRLARVIYHAARSFWLMNRVAEDDGE